MRVFVLPALLVGVGVALAGSPFVLLFRVSCFSSAFPPQTIPQRDTEGCIATAVGKVLYDGCSASANGHGLDNGS